MKQHCTNGLLLLTLCCIVSLTAAQRPVYRPSDHSWNVTRPERMAMKPQYASHDAVVLLEENSIRVHKVDPRFMSMFFEQKARIRYNTVQGILEHSRFILPLSFDRAMDQQNLPLARRGEEARPQYFNTEVQFFAARVLRSDGGVVEAEVLDSVAISQMKFGIKFHDAWSFVFDVEGLEPGDELEVHFKYSVPYDVNWAFFNSNRIFFHGNLAKQEYALSFRADTRQDLHIAGIAPHTTEKGRNIHTYFWEYDNLPACLNEVNARPYRELPHLIYGLSQSNLRYRYRHTLSFQSLEIPYWTYILKLRELNALWLRRVAKKRIPDRQNQLVDDFMHRVNSKEPNAAPILQFERIHEEMAQNFTFKKDDAWYNNFDMKLMKMGNQVKDGSIRELSRYDLYAKLIFNLELDYHTAYLLDERTGAINENFLTPLWNSEFAFVLFDQSIPNIFHPKGENLSLRANELPFYWQGSSALLADVDLLWSDFDQVPAFIELPELDPVYNYRNTNARVNVSLNKDLVNFETKLNMSGQFSTLTAPAYTGTSSDSTLSLEYGMPVFALNGKVALSKKERTYIENDAPFREQWRLKYSSKDLIDKRNDTVSLDLSGVLNFVVPDGFDATSRDLQFYWDVTFLDNFNYQLRFDKDIELIDASSADLNLNSNLGNAHFSCTQTSSKTIMVHAFLEVKQEVVPVSQADALQQLLDKVNALSQLKVRVLQLGRNDP